MGRDWIVTEAGQCQLCRAYREWDLLENPYRFYRFLTDVEDVLKETETADPFNHPLNHQYDCLPALRRLVRKLVINSYWLRSHCKEMTIKEMTILQSDNALFPTTSPPPKTSTKAALLNLYDEAGYPLTVQIEAIAPGGVSSIHTHGTWGIVAVLQGKEKNTFWQRQPEASLPDKIVCVGEKILANGDIISFMPTAIHQIESAGVEPLVTFNLYGETERKQRFEFDAINHRAKHY